MLARLDELAAARNSFAFETTGASRSFGPRIVGLRSAGYRFFLFYVWVRSVDISVQRVTMRAVLGGHRIPEPTIRRRYGRGLINFFDLYLPHADEWRFYDNSAPGDVILVADGGTGRREVVHGDDTWQAVLQMAKRARTEE